MAAALQDLCFKCHALRVTQFHTSDHHQTQLSCAPAASMITLKGSHKVDIAYEMQLASLLLLTIAVAINCNGRAAALPHLESRISKSLAGLRVCCSCVGVS